MNIEIFNQNTKMLVDFHRYSLPSGPPPVEFLHEHTFAEIHIAYQGALTIATKEFQHNVEANSAVIIPPGLHHCVSCAGDDTKWIAFLTTHNCTELVQKKFSPEFLADFFSKIDNNTNGENCDSIVNYILFMCNELTGACVYSDIPDRDYMDEIFSMISANYNKNFRILDIAEALHISETHARRIIKRHTGKSFRDLLLAHRMLIADALIKKNAVPLGEIAATVGYNSYSGFWKAYLKYKEETKNQ